MVNNEKEGWGGLVNLRGRDILKFRRRELILDHTKEKGSRKANLGTPEKGWARLGRKKNPKGRRSKDHSGTGIFLS